MRIGIDGRLYAQTGVGRYLKNLIEQLQLLDKENEYIVYLRSDEYDLVKLSNPNWQKKRTDIAWHTIGEQFKMPARLIKDKLDVAHFPYFNVPIFYPKKFLLTIHDLIIDHFDTGKASTLPYPLYLVKRIGYKRALAAGIKKASWITAISETTKQEIIDHYAMAKNKISVTYDALDENFLQVVKTQHTQNYYGFPYLLYVGNAYPHKNLERLIIALELLQGKQKIKLVLAGDDKYFFPRLKKYAEEKNLKDAVVFFGEANDEQLVNLYSYAQCLVFPSMMEGFGLPTFEAIACGVIPVISDIPVFKELWGSNVESFNPYDEEDIAAKIFKAINMTNVGKKKKLEILKKRIDDFSWKTTAYDTLDIYRKINET